MTPSAIRALREQVEAALREYDDFMSGGPFTETARALSTASSFAAAAHDKAIGGGEAHALCRAFLTALLDETSEDLDYLRADPAAGDAAREARDRLRALEEEAKGNG